MQTIEMNLTMVCLSCFCWINPLTSNSVRTPVRPVISSLCLSPGTCVERRSYCRWIWENIKHKPSFISLYIPLNLVLVSQVWSLLSLIEALWSQYWWVGSHVGGGGEALEYHLVDGKNLGCLVLMHSLLSCWLCAGCLLPWFSKQHPSKSKVWNL